MDKGPYTRPTLPAHTSSSSSSSSSSQTNPPSLRSQTREPSQSQSASRPLPTKKQKQPGEKPMLRRNQACLSCRKRKLRCDAVRPTCGTCMRSHKYALLHDRTGQISSEVPSCTYEEEPSANTPTEHSSSASGSTSSSTPAGVTSEVEPKTNQVGSLEASISKLPKLRSHPVNISDGSLMTAPGANVDGYNVRAQNSQSDIGLSQPISSNRAHPFHPVYPALRPPPPPLSSSSLESPQQDIAHQLSDASSNTFPSHGVSGCPPFAERLVPHPYVPPIPQESIYPNQPFSLWDQTILSTASAVVDKKPLETSSGNTWIAPTHDIPLKMEPPEQPNRLETGLISRVGPNQVFNNQAWNFNKTTSLEDEEAEKANRVLMDLLYPGWPPHLPNPMMLEHIVESFFRYIASVAGMFNKGRFMTRLTLPPSHPDFPHPAVLHAICAITSRFLGIVHTTPPADTAFDGRKVEKPWSKSILNPMDPKPIWDGLGSKRPGVVGGYFGRDGDFGQVHFSWGKLYIRDSKLFSNEWVSCIQALVILAHYCYQEARWVETWSMIGDAAQMASPLGLQTRRCHTFSVNPRNAPSNFLQPPKDEIETVERQNLFACLFGLDTLAASTSGWAPAIELSAVTGWIPTTLATVDPPYPPPYQDFQSADLFSYHPPETTAYSLLVKSTVLVRRVNDYVRMASERDIADPTGTAEFKQLDRWTSRLRPSFPLAFRDPFRSSSRDDDGRSVDETLLSAHTTSLLAIIQLHESYADSVSPTDRSNIRIREAVQHLLMLIHQLNATNVDFSSFHPYMGFTWFIAARSLARLISTSDQSSEAYRASLRNSIAVMQSASANIGVRLPVGLRHCWVIDQYLADSEKVWRTANNNMSWVVVDSNNGLE